MKLRGIFLCVAVVSVLLASTALAENTTFSLDVFSSTELAKAGAAVTEIVPSNGIAYGKDKIYCYFDSMEVYAKSEDGIEFVCKLPDIPSDAFSKGVIDTESRALLKDTVTYIVANDRKLYGYNVYSGKYGEIDTNGIYWYDTTLDFSCITPGEDQNPNRVVQSYLTDSMLYVFVSEIDAVTWDESYALYGIRLADGTANRISLINPINICMMDEETFLVLSKNADAYSLSRYNTKSNIDEKISVDLSQIPASWTIGGLAYDCDSKAIFLCTNDRVLRSLQGKDFSISGYLPSDHMLSETVAFVSKGIYYLFTVENLYSCIPSENPQQVQLICESGTLSDAVRNVFQAQNPDVLLTHIANAPTVEELNRMLLTGDDSIDIFEVSADYVFSEMKNKGWIAPLDDAPGIKADVAQMAPAVQAVLTDKNGKIVAFPFHISAWQYGIHRENWARVFGERNYPSSFDQLLDAWIEWESTGAEQFPEYDFVEAFDYESWCKFIIESYVRQNDDRQMLDLTNKELLSALEKLKAINDIRTQAGRTTKEVDANVEGFDGYIFTKLMLEPLTTPDEAYVWTALSFGEASVRQMDVKLEVLIVNPHSKHLEEALGFISCLTNESIDPTLYYAVHPSLMKPLENPEYEQRISQSTELVNDLNTQLDKCTPDQREHLTDQLQEAQYAVVEAENERYIISPAAIANYQRYSEFNFHTNNVLLGTTAHTMQENMESAIQRYAQGELSIENMMNELSRIMKMIMLEGM
ncbi:MAG: hypothetical protein RR696_13990 [Clostridia bacterium]